MIIIKKKTANMLTKIKYFTFFVCLFFASKSTVYSQKIDSTSYTQYKFLRLDLNRIENDSTSLKSFYKKLEKLEKLEKTQKGRVTITHIGDSHIQADFLSGTIRQKIQLKFGNAGRGLIFPYRAAKSNEPSSYKTTTNN